MRKWYPAVIVGAAYAIGFALYGRLPERVPVHWTAHGQINGWSGRGVAVWEVPTIALGIWLLLRWLPTVDPRRTNYAKFQSTYDFVVNLIVTFLVVTHLAVLASAAGYPIDINRVLPLLLGGLFVVIGNLLPRARPNWWFGIRTPWTMSNDRVWARTHRVGGYLFMAAGVLILLTALLRPAVVNVVIPVSVGVTAVISILYSYVAWRDEGAA